MKVSTLLSSLFLLGPTVITTAQTTTQEEFDGIQACCNSGCQEACGWVEDPDNAVPPTIVRRPQTLSGAVGGFPTRPRPGVGRSLQETLQGEDLINANCCVNSGGSGGDPHVMTWNGGYFDYHGQCDLVLVDAPGFAQGLGLTIHVRTQIRQDYSFIETAAIRIGKHDDILEVGSYGEHVLNGVEAAGLEGQFLSAFPIEYQMVSKKRHRVAIDLGDNQKVVFNTMKDWVSVTLENATAKDFASSKGLMGRFFTGTRLARDGSTEMQNDDNAYGQEWQVTAEESGLFSNPDREPQASKGQQCVLPRGSAGASRRRLGEKEVSEEAARLACQHHPEESVRSMCVYDVLAADDLDMAQTGAF